MKNNSISNSNKISDKEESSSGAKRIKAISYQITTDKQLNQAILDLQDVVIQNTNETIKFYTGSRIESDQRIVRKNPNIATMKLNFNYNSKFTFDSKALFKNEQILL